MIDYIKEYFGENKKNKKKEKYDEVVGMIFNDDYREDYWILKARVNITCRDAYWGVIGLFDAYDKYMISPSVFNFRGNDFRDLFAVIMNNDNIQDFSTHLNMKERKEKIKKFLEENK